MNAEQYETTQSQLLTLAGLVKLMPLQDFIAAADHAETIGPFVDPTLFIQAGKKLAAIKYLARALKHFQDAVIKFPEEVS